MCFLLMMLRVRGSWNMRLNISVFLVVIIEKILEDSRNVVLYRRKSQKYTFC